MSVKTRWLIVLLALVLLLGIVLSGAGAAPSAQPPPEHPYLWPEITISDFNNVEGVPDVTYNRKHNEYFVVWQTYDPPAPATVRGARISATGRLLANFQINGHPSKPSLQPAVDYDPLHDRYLVVFIFGESSGSSKPDLVGRFIPWKGPDPAFKSFPIAAWSTTQIDPDVAYGRAMDEFLVVWGNLYAPPSPLPNYISGRRIRAADGSFPGTGSDMTISQPSQVRNSPRVTYNLARNEYLVVYDNQEDILGTRFTGDLNHDFGGEFSIAGWPDIEIRPAVAACHAVNQYFVVWQSDQGSGNKAIYGRFISGSGANGDVHKIDDTTGIENLASVSCSDSGNQYLVTWQTEYANLKFGVWARFLLPDGKMGDQFAVQHPDNQSHRTQPAVAGGKTSFMAVWEHERGNSGRWDIHGRLISPYAVFAPVTRGR